MHSPSASSVPPPLPRASRRMRFSLRRRWIISFALALAVGLVLTEYLWLRARRAAWMTAVANERVADHIATARARMAAQHWEESIRHLEDALAVERATNSEEAHPLLEEARRGQADSLLEAAELAIAHKDSTSALHLLRAYLAHPQATKPDRARLLLDDLERAISDDEAARLLAHLSDDALSLFTQRGQLTEEDGIHTVVAREIFKDTLRRILAKEVQKREARREIERLAEQRRAAERIRRIALLRATPAFRDLSAFVAQTREQLRDREQAARRQDAELQQLFQQLNVNDPAEQAEIRADLLGKGERAGLSAAVKRKRAEIKRAYRASPQFNAADAELFDQLVDEELDKLLKLLSSS
jgi:hypothetical protein